MVAHREVIRRRLRPCELRVLPHDGRHLWNEEVDVLDLGLHFIQRLAVVHQEMLVRLLRLFELDGDLEEVFAFEVELRR